MPLYSSSIILINNENLGSRFTSKLNTGDNSLKIMFMKKLLLGAIDVKGGKMYNSWGEYLDKRNGFKYSKN
jgi:hypothetical protein